MKYLEQLRQQGTKKEIVPGVVPPKLTKPAFVSSVGRASPPVGSFEWLRLLPVQEAARLDVIGRLMTHPEVERAFVTRFEGDMLIIALAVRGIGTCELKIAADRVQTAEDYAALVRCLDQPEGSA